MAGRRPRGLCGWLWVPGSAGPSRQAAHCREGSGCCVSRDPSTPGSIYKHVFPLAAWRWCWAWQGRDVCDCELGGAGSSLEDQRHLLGHLFSLQTASCVNPLGSEGRWTQMPPWGPFPAQPAWWQCLAVAWAPSPRCWDADPLVCRPRMCELLPRTPVCPGAGLLGLAQ